jgi:hypothetical protein
MPALALAERRASNALRQRRCRARRAAHTAIFPVEAGEDVITLLCRTGWLAKADDHDPAKIAAAIGLLLADTARNLPSRVTLY